MVAAVPVLIALIALLLAFPGLASAATFCVHQPSDTCGPGQIDKGANLQGALTDALANGGDDDVLIGAGEYSGPFAYSGLAAVNIRGVGDATVLQAPNANGTTVLDLALSAAATVSNLRIDVPVGNSTQTNYGLWIMGTASGVNIVIPPSVSFNTVGAELNGGAFKGGSVTGPFDTYYVTGIGATSTAPALIEDVRVQAYRAVSSAGAATIRRVDAVARTGFYFQSENPAGGRFLLEDTLWRTPPGATEGVGLQAGCGSNVDLDLTARNLTLVNEATGPDFNYTVAAVCNLATRSVAVDLSSSIVSGGLTSLNAWGNDGPATIHVSYTDYDPTKTQVVGAGVITEGPGNVNVAPGFVGPSDFHLLRESPLVDIGDPAALTAGESATDLDGAPRIAFARRDIGAFELQPLPPAAPPGSGPPSGPAADTVAPTLGRLRVEPRRFRVAPLAKPRPSASAGTKIRFRLSESSAVRLRIQRPLPGRRAGGRCRKPTQRLRRARRCTRYRVVGTITRRGLAQGANAIPFSGRLRRRALRPGSYRVLADAADSAGNRSRSFNARFTVLKPLRR
jgi:hypothetical protein